MLIHGKRLYKLIISIILLSISLNASSVELRVSGTDIVEGSSMDLQIVAEGKNIEFPILDDIGGFPIENKSISTKMESSYVNGSFSSKNIKTLNFSFFPETDMTIPAFTVTINGKKYKTKALKIKVVKASAVTSKSANGYIMSMESNKADIFVGEPFIVTVNFFEPRTNNTAKVEYTPPKFKDFYSKALGKEKLLKSATGTIHKLQYLLTAKRDGNFTIAPPKARVGIRDFNGANRDPWGFFSNDIKWKSIRAKSLRVLVKQLPVNADLIGLFKVTSSVDKKSVKPNSPVSYTIKISGEGNLEDIANPKFDLDGVTVYADDAKTTSKIVNGKAMSSYERKYVFISDKDFIIPSLVFKTFDYKSKKSKKLRAKQYKISVTGSNTSPNNKNIKNNTSTSNHITNSKKSISEKVKKEKNILEDTEYYKKQIEKTTNSYHIWFILLAYVAGIITMLLINMIKKSWKPNRNKSILTRRYSNSEALEILYPHINEDTRIENMVRKLYKIKNGDKSISIDKKDLESLILSVRNR